LSGSVAVEIATHEARRTVLGETPVMRAAASTEIDRDAPGTDLGGPQNGGPAPGPPPDPDAQS
jgi:hypothetical protein